MELRKVMLLGKSSLAISLPKNWIDSVGLKKGDSVSLETQRDKSLTIFPNFKKREEIKDIALYIDTDESGNSIQRNIIACYLNGYTHLKLISKKIFSTIQQEAIRSIARLLYIRIMESDSKNIQMTTYLEESKASVMSNIHRMYMISASMCKDVLKALIDQNVDLARSVYSLDDDVDQFCFFILRMLRGAAIDPILARKLEIDTIDCQDYQVFVYRVEHVADLAATIAKHIIRINELKLKIPPSLLKLLYTSGNKAINLYEQSVKCFLSNEVANCDAIIEQKKDIEESDEEIASKTFRTPQLKDKTVCSVCSIREAIRRIGEWATSIAENSIVRSYSKV
ncbi:MAG: PhoU domain-containing protein [Promethearchaeota archaeon]